MHPKCPGGGTAAAFRTTGHFDSLRVGARDVLCAGCYATRTALSTYDEIGRSLPASRYTHGIFSALRRGKAEGRRRCLNHLITEDCGRSLRTIELESSPPLRYVNRVGLHLVDHLLLRLTCTDRRGDRSDSDSERIYFHGWLLPDSIESRWAKNTCGFRLIVAAGSATSIRDYHMRFLSVFSVLESQTSELRRDLSRGRATNAARLFLVAQDTPSPSTLCCSKKMRLRPFPDIAQKNALRSSATQAGKQAVDYSARQHKLNYRAAFRSQRHEPLSRRHLYRTRI